MFLTSGAIRCEDCKCTESCHIRMRLFRITLNRRMAHKSVANPKNILTFAVSFHQPSEQRSFDLPRMSREKDLLKKIEVLLLTG